MCERCRTQQNEQTEQYPTVWGERPDFRQIAYDVLNQSDPLETENLIEWFQNVANEQIFEV